MGAADVDGALWTVDRDGRHPCPLFPQTLAPGLSGGSSTTRRRAEGVGRAEIAPWDLAKEDTVRDPARRRGVYSAQGGGPSGDAGRGRGGAPVSASALAADLWPRRGRGAVTRRVRHPAWRVPDVAKDHQHGLGPGCGLRRQRLRGCPRVLRDGWQEGYTTNNNNNSHNND